MSLHRLKTLNCKSSTMVQLLLLSLSIEISSFIKKDFIKSILKTKDSQLNMQSKLSVGI